MKYAFLITHFGSGGDLLCRILSTSLKIRCCGRSNIIYNHPEMLNTARAKIDEELKLKPDNDWYVDQLIHNYEFTCKPLYKVCKFIYLIRSPEIPIVSLMSSGFSLKDAENYYLFRLRRMCEMATETGGILITYEDLITKRALLLLKNFFELKSLLSYLPEDEVKGSIPKEVLEKCTISYNKYLRFLETKTDLIRFAV